MKQRDSVLFALPIAAAVVMLIFAFILYRQYTIFEKTISPETIKQAVSQARIMMVLTLLFGFWLVLPLFFYVYKNIRKPLNSLLKSMEQVAAGNLETKIEVPQEGIVQDIALSAASMAEQLRFQLNRANADKDEKTAILNAMTEAVLLISGDGKAIRCNQTAEKLFGFSGENFQISRCGIPELPEEVRKTFAGDGDFEKEMYLMRNGVKLTLFVKGLLLKDDFSSCVLLTITDLTNLRTLESFRSDFIANVSHEIKTPLTGIASAAELLEEDALPGQQKKKILDLLLTQTKRLNALVQDILSLAALERKQSAENRDFAPLDLDSTLQNAVCLCRERAGHAGIALNITNNEPIRMEGDAQLLEQAVINILNNAINYSGSTEIDISLIRKNGNAVISIRDYGIGIAAEHQERIFERFYRIHKERSRELGGTGLGLAIVKHICQLHGGKAELESKSGEGCTFRLILTL